MPPDRSRESCRGQVNRAQDSQSVHRLRFERLAFLIAPDVLRQLGMVDERISVVLDSVDSPIAQFSSR